MNLYRIATRSFLPALLVAIFVLSSCGGPLSGIATVEFVFDSEPVFRATTATMTPNLPFDIVTYTIRGSGPDVGSGPLEFEISTGENRHVVDALVFGAWEIEVSGHNENGEILATGLSVVDITSAGTVTIELGPVEGSGSLSIAVEATRVPPGSSLIAIATNADGNEVVIDAVLSDDGFNVTKELPSGSYLVEFSMRDETGEALSGAIEAIYILAGFDTSGVVQIAMLPAPDGEITFEIDSAMTLPEPAVLVVESQEPYFTGDDVITRLESRELAGGEISWFLSGTEADPLSTLGDTFQIRITTPGLYRIDAILSIGGRASASDSTILEIIDPYLYGSFAYVMTQKDNENRVDGISGARACVVHPSGAALYVAGNGESSIGYFTIDKASLRPLFVSRIVSTGLAGVTDLSVNESGSVLAAAGSKNNLITLIALEAGEPGEIGTIDPAGFVETPVLGVVGVAFAPDDHLYVLAAESNTLLEFSLDGLVATLVSSIDLSSIETAPISEPLSVLVSPDGAWFAISAKGSDSITIFDRSIGIPANEITHFADGSNGVERLNGGGGIAFTEDSNTLFAVAYYDDALSRFDLGENGWAYSGSVENEESGSFGFHYPRDVVVASDNTHLAVASSGDDAVAFFALPLSNSGLNEETGPIALPEFVDAAINGVGRVTGLDGARSIAMHPTGRAIYVASANDSSLATFVAR